MLEWLEVLLEAILDTAKILPFLFLAYLLMEWLEHRGGERVERAVAGAGKAGPFIGGALGLLPQCGFSAAAAGLFAGRVVTVGTLLAVFLSTSDEMIAVFLGQGLGITTVLKILAIKLAVAVLFGFLADLLFSRKKRGLGVQELCEEPLRRGDPTLGASPYGRDRSLHFNYKYSAGHGASHCRLRATYRAPWRCARALAVRGGSRGAYPQLRGLGGCGNPLRPRGALGGEDAFGAACRLGRGSFGAF